MSGRQRTAAIVKAATALALVVVTICLALFANANPAWVTYSYKPFSRGFVRTIGLAWGLLPFSAAEILVYCGIVLLIERIVKFIIRLVRSDARATVVARFAANVGLTAAILFAFFQIGWGINYSALPLADELGLTVRARPTEALEALALELVDELNALVSTVPRDADGGFLRVPLDEVTAGVRSGYAALAVELPQTFGKHEPQRAKSVLASRVMSYTNITGIFMPFTGEPNVNTDVHPSAIPFTTAHEMAHSLGVAPEDEANFTAFLACRDSDHPAVRYSGYLAAFSYVYNAYAGEVAEAYLVYNQLDQQVVNDYRQRSAYWQSLAATPVQQAIKQVATTFATAVNDSYIQAMGIPDGVKSYGMVVDLLLAEMEERSVGRPRD